jgi:hypothetical protein
VGYAKGSMNKGSMNKGSSDNTISIGSGDVKAEDKSSGLGGGTSGTINGGGAGGGTVGVLEPASIALQLAGLLSLGLLKLRNLRKSAGLSNWKPEIGRSTSFLQELRCK